MKDKIFSLIKDKKSFQIQKSLFDFINNSNLSEKISRKEDIYKLVDNEISDLTLNLAKIYNIDVEYNSDLSLQVSECFESLISKSLHNTFISAYEQDDIRFKKLINKIHEIVDSKNLSLEKFLKVENINGNSLNYYNNNNSQSINSQIISKDFNYVINKFKNDLYHFQSAKDKLTTINYLFYSIKQKILNIDSYLDLENSKSLRRVLSYILVKADVTRIFSNLQFIKTFKLISSMSTQEQYFVNILFNCVKRLKLKLKKFYSLDKETNYSMKGKDLKNLSSKESNINNICNSSSFQSQNGNGSDTSADKSDCDEVSSNINTKDDTFSFYSYKIKPKVSNSKSTSKSEELNIHDDDMNFYSESLLKINTEKTRKEYFEGHFKDLDKSKFEAMTNDFKITLKLIESFKYSIKSNINSELVDN
jgi:hypothetical protein